MWRRSTSEHGRSTQARTCSRRAPGRPASGWAVRWEAWSCLKLPRDEHNINVLTYQVKQEKAGQEQASTSPYPSSFPEALGFPSYEAAMNQYGSVSPTQGCLDPTLGLFWRKSSRMQTVRLSFNNVLLRAVSRDWGSIWGPRAIRPIRQLRVCRT